MTVNFLPGSRCRVKRHEPLLFTPVTLLRRLTRQRSPGNLHLTGQGSDTRLDKRPTFIETNSSGTAGMTACGVIQQRSLVALGQGYFSGHSWASTGNLSL